MKGAIVSRIENWMFDQALPFWSEFGLDRTHGGYVESFQLDGRTANTDFKRVRVIARQLYVFSHASLLGFQLGADCARHGFEFLIQHGWQGSEGGWARTLFADGSVKDPIADLYDNAFALFALSWYHRASGDPKAHDWAIKTADYIHQHLRHPSGKGFLHWKPMTGLRQQNPHMHLLEACLASYEACPDARTAALAQEVADLFKNYFFDLETRTLAEFFEDDWSRANGPDGQMIEPGHQFEWAWILVNLKRLLGIDLSEHARALIQFGEDFGVNPDTFATYDGVWTDGSLRDSRSRSWPTTERIKAAVARSTLDGVGPTPVFEQSAGLLLDRYLAVEPKGCWIDQFDASGKALSDKVPASTLYHVFLAFSEVLRVSKG